MARQRQAPTIAGLAAARLLRLALLASACAGCGGAPASPLLRRLRAAGDHEGKDSSHGAIPKDFKRIDASALAEHGMATPYTSQAELNNLLRTFKDVKNPDTIRYVPPVPSDGGPLAVGVRIELVKFQDLDEVAGTVNLVLDLILRWADERLAFKPAALSGSARAGEKLPVTSNLIWTPDIVVLNQVAGVEHMFANKHTPIVIADDAFRKTYGVNVIWKRRINIKSRCSIDMMHFPFDRQKCDIIIGSWASSRRQMLLIPDTNQKFEQGEDIHTSEFQVSNVSVKKTAVFMKGSLEKFEEVQYNLVLQRYPHYWMVNYILPMFAVTMLTIATMWMSNAGTRMNSGTRLLLCIVQITNITASWRPANESDIWLDRFQTHCLALSIASVLQSCVVDYLKNSGLFDLGWAPRDHVVDTLLRTVICFLAICVFVSDLCDLQERGGNDMVGLYGSFHGHSSKLLVGLIYMIFLCLGTSSVISTLWLVLPTELWGRINCKGCASFASGVERDQLSLAKSALSPQKSLDKRNSSPT